MTERVYATVEGAKALMQRLQQLGIVAKITIGDDGRYKVEAADGQHVCHWPGCGKPVPAAMWGCKAHWFALPKRLRDRIWATYRRGQEITKTPSPKYIEAALEVQSWIAAYTHSPSAGRWSMSTVEFCYVATKVGKPGYCGAAGDDPKHQKDVAKTVAKWIRDGLVVSRVPLEDARRGLVEWFKSERRADPTGESHGV